MLSRIRCVFLPLLYFSAVVMLSTSLWIISFYQTFSPPQNVSLCNCDKCVMDYHKGFSEIINKTPEPFLSTKNNITESVFNWWMRLQGERRNFSSYKETVEKVFQLFPPATKLSESSPEVCRTCAVVGNSGNLKGSHYGPMIDYHDIVIRMNKAPTKGYERDVGTKTTHHVMYPHSATYLNDTTYLLLFPFKTSDLDWLIKCFTMIDEKDKNLGLLANKDLVMILNPAFIQYVHRAWLRKKGMYPSTGFLTVVLSLHMCDEVDVFGFGADRRGNWNHYFERLRKKRLRTGHHPGKIEFRNILWLRRLKKIQFFSGW